MLLRTFWVCQAAASQDHRWSPSRVPSMSYRVAVARRILPPALHFWTLRQFCIVCVAVAVASQLSRFCQKTPDTAGLTGYTGLRLLEAHQSEAAIFHIGVAPSLLPFFPEFCIPSPSRVASGSEPPTGSIARRGTPRPLRRRLCAKPPQLHRLHGCSEPLWRKRAALVLR